MVNNAILFSKFGKTEKSSVDRGNTREPMINYDISLARRTDKNELVTIPDADILFIFEQDELGFSVGWCGTPDPFWP